MGFFIAIFETFFGTTHPLHTTYDELATNAHFNANKLSHSFEWRDFFPSLHVHGFVYGIIESIPFEKARKKISLSDHKIHRSAHAYIPFVIYALFTQSTAIYCYMF